MIDQYLHKMTDANTIEAAWDVHTAKMNEYGFDRLLYAYTRFGTGSSLGDLQDALILTNQDPAYVDEFIGQGMYSKGPMVAWASENTGSCSWSVIRAQIAAGYDQLSRGVFARQRGHRALRPRRNDAG